MHTLLRFTIAVVGSLMTGAWAGYGFFAFAPCDWFSATSEGACGIRAIGVAVLLGLVVASVCFVISLRFAMAKVSAPRPVAGSEVPKRFVILWAALFILNFFALAAVPLLPNWSFDAYKFIAFMLFPALVVTSALLAPYRGYPPSMALVAFVPVAGSIVAGILLLISRPAVTKFSEESK